MRITTIIILCSSLVACDPGSSDGEDQLPVAGAADAQPGAWCTGGHDSGHKTIGVMTRNLYLGADLVPALAATDLDEFLAATTAIWTMVLSNDFNTRVEALADEIADRRPALVGLQEAVTWRTQFPSDGTATPATDVAYDFAPQLIDALAARGLHYRAAAEVTGFDFEAPTLLGIDVRLTDHDVILARQGVKTAHPTAVVYDTLLPVSLLGQAALVRRGYVTVDVKDRGRRFEFVNTHLEAFDAGIRTQQAAQLADDLAGAHRPIILVGDLNSEPGTEGEAVLAAAGFDDVWAELFPDDPGFTCCWPEDLHETEPPLSQRIDYVLTRGWFDPRDAELSGDQLDDRVGGLWPSDHAGLFAELAVRHRPGGHHQGR